MSSPEDHPSWSGKPRKNKVCTACTEVVVKWHCDETGCPWCEACGPLGMKK